MKKEAMTMDKLKMHSPNFVDQNIAKIAELFPNCVTESRNEKGELQCAIDFDLLKQELSAQIVIGPQERYPFNWSCKREALLTPLVLKKIKVGGCSISKTKTEGKHVDLTQKFQEYLRILFGSIYCITKEIR